MSEIDKLGKHAQEVTLEIRRILGMLNGEQLVEALELALAAGNVQQTGKDVQE